MRHSIAKACISRLSIDRDLEVAPGYMRRNGIKDRRTQNIYRSIEGELVTRKSISENYKVSEYVVRDIFNSVDNDFAAAHQALSRRL